MRPRSTAVFVGMMLIGIAVPLVYTYLEMEEKRALRLIHDQQQLEAPQIVEIHPPAAIIEASPPVTASAPAAAHTPALVDTPPLIAPEHAIYLDRMSGNDMADAIKAWNDLALLYTSEKELVRDFGPAMQDTRLIPFVLSEESWTDTNSKSYRYCAAHDVVPAESKQTVGYALQCHQLRLKETGQ